MFARELQYLFLLTVLLAPTCRAEPVRLTIYDDGRSCPNECDAHVVFNKNLNGTAYAHAPHTRNGFYKKCAVNAECRICFSAGDSQCLTVMYRGNGPRTKIFDFTPAFYQEYCGRSDIPKLLAQKCAEFRLDAWRLTGRTNCFRHPDEDVCEDIMAQARARKEQDELLYTECQDKGEAAYNRGRKRKQQRTYNCAYEKYPTGGPSKSGTTWHRLLPGACRPGTFVGKDGLDCCSGNPFADGPLGRECLDFYPDRQFTYSSQKPAPAIP